MVCVEKAQTPYVLETRPLTPVSHFNVLTERSRKNYEWTPKWGEYLGRESKVESSLIAKGKKYRKKNVGHKKTSLNDVEPHQNRTLVARPHVEQVK